MQLSDRFVIPSNPLFHNDGASVQPRQSNPVRAPDPKHRATLLLVVVSMLGFLAGPVPAQTQRTGGPPALEVTRPKIHLGTLVRGRVVDAEFELRNTGGRTLEITDARPGCKCTVASYDKRIPPGGVGYLRAQLDTRSLSGSVGRPITVYSNDPRRPSTRLILEAVVLASVDLLPDDRPLLTNRNDQALTAVRLIRKDGTEQGDLSVTEVQPTVDWLSAKVTQLKELRRAGDGLPTGRAGEYLIEVALDGQPPRGRSEVGVKFKTGLSREPEYEMQVVVDYAPVVQISSSEFVVPYQPQKGQAFIPAPLGVRRDLDPKQLKVTTEPKQLKARLEASGERFYTVHLNWSGKPPASGGWVIFTVGDESYRVPVVTQASATSASR